MAILENSLLENVINFGAVMEKEFNLVIYCTLGSWSFSQKPQMSRLGFGSEIGPKFEKYQSKE
jgi:hypothetical protein